MDAYRDMFVLCTINGLCAWHQAIAGPFNNKNLNAKSHHKQTDLLTALLEYAMIITHNKLHGNNSETIYSLPCEPDHFCVMPIPFSSRIAKSRDY